MNADKGLCGRSYSFLGWGSKRMPIGRRLVKVMLLGMVLCLSTSAVGLWYAYWYVTDSETAARVIREHAVRYFQHAILKPGRVRVRPLVGQMVLHQIQLMQRIDGVVHETLQIPWLNVRLNPRKLFHGCLEAREIVISQPTLRLRQRRNGTWNVQDLLADPWPGPWIETPPILIRNATLEVIPYEPLATDGASTHSSTVAPGALDPSVISLANANLPAQTVTPVRASKVMLGRSPVVLRDVALKIESNGGPARIRFEGSARGDVFDRLAINGSIDFDTGRITLNGELLGLTLSETLRRRIPREGQAGFRALALNGGVVDLELSRFSYDPTATSADLLHYQVQARLRDGVWECPKLPFFINDLSAQLTVEDGVMTIKHAQGTNGGTTLGIKGTVGLDDVGQSPINLCIDATARELDQRLRARTPLEYDELWDVFRPRGQVNAEVRVAPHYPRAG